MQADIPKDFEQERKQRAKDLLDRIEMAIRLIYDASKQVVEALDEVAAWEATEPPNLPKPSAN